MIMFTHGKKKSFKKPGERKDEFTWDTCNAEIYINGFCPDLTNFDDKMIKLYEVTSKYEEIWQKKDLIQHLLMR